MASKLRGRKIENPSEAQKAAWEKNAKRLSALSKVRAERRARKLETLHRRKGWPIETLSAAPTPIQSPEMSEEEADDILSLLSDKDE